MSSSLLTPPSLPAALRSSTTTAAPRSALTNFSTTINCSLKHRQSRARDSPMKSAEDLAARLGFDIMVDGLERLYHFGGGGNPPSPSSDPGRRLRVAYQGVRGSYCHDAATSSSTPIDAFPCSNFEDAFTAVETRSADRAVVPAENSLDGPVDRNLDLLLRHPDVSIVGELVVPVNHCLLAMTSNIRRVVSHPQALSHCQHRLNSLNVEVEEVACAADAARYIAENRVYDTAVIGSRIAAREFGLNVIEENLQGSGSNFTRFLQLGLGRGYGAAAAKTSLAFTLKSGPSELYKAMLGFESRGVRVSRVDHRPNRARPVRVDGGSVRLDYVFVIDVEGSQEDEGVAEGIRRLREVSESVRVLGCYTCANRERM